ncbi:MAG: hypothetical protein JXR37_11075 [Kiritimatiellae bacterium]|nr:hypothetical protein [Kiritimatiellia bacterium]
MATDPRGTTYRCPVCGAEVGVLAPHCATFRPRCCNTEMARVTGRIQFYTCKVCGAEIGVVKQGARDFAAICCGMRMSPRAA